MTQTKDDVNNAGQIAKEITLKLLPWLFLLVVIISLCAFMVFLANEQMGKMLELKGVKEITLENYVYTNLIGYARLVIAVALSCLLGWLFNIFPVQRRQSEKDFQRRSDAWLKAFRIWCANAETLSKLDPLLVEKFVDDGLKPFDGKDKKEILDILLEIKESSAMPQQKKNICISYEGELATISKKENSRYRAELHAALDMWLSFECAPVPSGCSPKSEIAARLVDWQNENGIKFLDSEVERICKMVNWDKDGNKQKPKKE
mgnify:CR=1 FL=1